jgi:hypothetical protein
MRLSEGALGPLLVEALAAANETPFGLPSGICTTRLKQATPFHCNS